MSAYRLSAIGYRQIARVGGRRARPFRSLFFVLLSLAAPVCALAQQSPALSGRAVAPSLRQRMLAEEDARSTTPLALLQALKGDNAELRRVGVRALGRLEQPDVSAALVHFLSDPEASVRVEAANALAQSVFATTDACVGRRLPRASCVTGWPLKRTRSCAAPWRCPSRGCTTRPTQPDARRRTWRSTWRSPRTPNGVATPASPAVLVNALRGLVHAALARGLPGAVTRDPAGPPVTWLSDEARRTLAAFVVPRLECLAAPPPAPQRPRRRSRASGPVRASALVPRRQPVSRGGTRSQSPDVRVPSPGAPGPGRHAHGRSRAGAGAVVGTRYGRCGRSPPGGHWMCRGRRTRDRERVVEEWARRFEMPLRHGARRSHGPRGGGGTARARRPVGVRTLRSRPRPGEQRGRQARVRADPLGHGRPFTHRRRSFAHGERPPVVRRGCPVVARLDALTRAEPPARAADTVGGVLDRRAAADVARVHGASRPHSRVTRASRRRLRARE